jgi:GNAT superfamily N-acetyltransferase
VSAHAIATRPYAADDEAGVLALLRLSLGSGRAFDRTAAFWQWKHFRNPFGVSLLIVAASAQILGLRAFMRWRLHDGERTLAAVRAVDTATHPDARRSGVFSRLTEQAVEQARREGVDLIFNTPNPISLAGYLKLGWRHLGRPRLLVRVLRPLRVARVLMARGAHRHEDAPVLRPPILPVDSLLAEEGGLEALLHENERLAGRGIRTVKGTLFMRWRYGEAPGLPYYACWRRGRRIAAAVVLRSNLRRGLREVVLSELLIGADGAADAAALLRDVTTAIDADYLVAHAPGGSRHAQVLRRAGFVPVPRVGPHFAVRPLSPAAEDMAATRLSAWHLSLGDLEVF